jgi:hypothetical protein
MGLPPTSTKGSGDTNPVTTFEFDFPNNTITHTGVKASVGTLTIAGGGTGQTTANAGFNALSPMTTGGDIIYGGASGVATRLANGSSGQVLTSGGGTTAPSWTAPAPLWSVSAVKTTTYSILTTDNLVLVDGTSAFTATLPTAVGVTGKQYTIKRVDQTLANAVTIATTSSQTIDGVTTKKLSTQYEQFTVVSDGSNWQTVAHDYPQGWVSYTPTITGYGSATNVAAKWRRVGDSLEVMGSFTAGTVSGVVLSSFTIPSGLAIGSMTISNTTSNQGPIVGTFGANGTGGNSFCITATGTSTSIIYTGSSFSSSAQLTPAVGSSAGTSSAVSAFEFIVPITNWEA